MRIALWRVNRKIISKQVEIASSKTIGACRGAGWTTWCLCAEPSLVCRAEVGLFLVWQLRLRFLGHQILRPNRRLSRQSSRPPIQYDLRDRDCRMCFQDSCEPQKRAR